MRIKWGIPVLMWASVATAQQQPYRDAHGEAWYFLQDGVIQTGQFDPSPRVVCDVEKLLHGEMPFSVSCPGRQCGRQLRASPSGRYVAVAGVIPHDRNPFPAAANPIRNYSCEQYSLDTPKCDAVLGVVDLTSCRLVGVANLHYSTFPDNDWVNYYFTSDEKVLVIDDHILEATPLTKVFSIPELRPIGEYPVTLYSAGVETPQTVYCFSNGYCAFRVIEKDTKGRPTQKTGWAVINMRSGKLVRSRFEVELPGVKRDGTITSLSPLSVRPGAPVSDGDVLTFLEPLWADENLWIQHVRTEKRVSGDALASKTFLISVRDYDVSSYTATDLPAGAENPRLKWSGTRGLTCVVDLKEGKGQITVALPQTAPNVRE